MFLWVLLEKLSDRNVVSSVSGAQMYVPMVFFHRPPPIYTTNGTTKHESIKCIFLTDFASPSTQQESANE